jgi:hypothetical protein
VPSLCEGLNKDQIATLPGLRFDAGQTTMHVVRRRVHAASSVFAVQQVSGGKQNPIGSEAEALDHDWACQTVLSPSLSQQLDALAIG